MQLPFSEQPLIACRECDALHRQMPHRTQTVTVARCARCGAMLYQTLTRDGVERLFILALTSALLFVIVNSLPIVELKTHGFSNQMTLIGGIAQLWSQKMWLIAAIVLCATMFCPFIELTAVTCLLVLLLRADSNVPGFKKFSNFNKLLQVIQRAQPWVMIEVLLLGALVASFKLSSAARIIPGPALFALGGLAFSFAVTSAHLRHLCPLADRKIHINEISTFTSTSTSTFGLPTDKTKDTASNPCVISARCAGLIACSICAHIHHRCVAHRLRLRCARCGTILYSRKPDSLARTWSLLVTAAMFIIPANLLPIMHRQSIFGLKDDTIMSGIAYFWTSGSWALAVLIFVASVLVPILKLMVLGILAFTAQFGLCRQPLRHAKLYRLIKYIGRWSMLDIFVVMFTVVLVQFRPLVTVTAGLGIFSFGLMVVLTMFALMQFDSRLIWDAYEGLTCIDGKNGKKR